MLCIVYDENLDFHKNRAELYDDSILALLKRWDTTRRIARFEPYKQLTPARKVSLLSRIAVKTFDNDEYFFKRKRLIKLIAEYVENLKDIDSTEVNNVSKSVLDAIISNHGIFALRAKGIYSFGHLTFQEYFTAKYVYEHAAKGASFSIVKLTNNPKWREVFLLTTSMLDEADEFLLEIHNFSTEILKNNDDLQRLFTVVFEKSILDSNPNYLQKAVAIFIVLDRRLARSLRDEENILIARNTLRSILKTLDKYFNIDKYSVDGRRERFLSSSNANPLSYIDKTAKKYNISVESTRIIANGNLRIENNSALARDLVNFLKSKLRLFECLSTECYISRKNRIWLINNLLESKEYE